MNYYHIIEKNLMVENTNTIYGIYNYCVLLKENEYLKHKILGTKIYPTNINDTHRIKKIISSLNVYTKDPSIKEKVHIWYRSLQFKEPYTLSGDEKLENYKPYVSSAYQYMQQPQTYTVETVSGETYKYTKE